MGWHYSGVRVFGGTFFVFCDYLKPACVCFALTITSYLRFAMTIAVVRWSNT
ncbi:MAG: hypothetical protein ACLRQX_04960 [Turicibacter sanguinis]